MIDRGRLGAQYLSNGGPAGGSFADRAASRASSGGGSKSKGKSESKQSGGGQKSGSSAASRGEGPSSSSNDRSKSEDKQSRGGGGQPGGIGGRGDGEGGNRNVASAATRGGVASSVAPSARMAASNALAPGSQPLSEEALATQKRNQRALGAAAGLALAGPVGGVLGYMAGPSLAGPMGRAKDYLADGIGSFFSGGGGGDGSSFAAPMRGGDGEGGNQIFLNQVVPDSTIGTVLEEEAQPTNAYESLIPGFREAYKTDYKTQAELRPLLEAYLTEQEIPEDQWETYIPGIFESMGVPEAFVAPLPTYGGSVPDSTVADPIGSFDSAQPSLRDTYQYPFISPDPMPVFDFMPAPQPGQMPPGQMPPVPFQSGQTQPPTQLPKGQLPILHFDENGNPVYGGIVGEQPLFFAAQGGPVMNYMNRGIGSYLRMAEGGEAQKPPTQLPKGQLPILHFVDEFGQPVYGGIVGDTKHRRPGEVPESTIPSSMEDILSAITVNGGPGSTVDTNPTIPSSMMDIYGAITINRRPGEVPEPTMSMEDILSAITVNGGPGSPVYTRPFEPDPVVGPGSPVYTRPFEPDPVVGPVPPVENLPPDGGGVPDVFVPPVTGDPITDSPYVAPRDDSFTMLPDNSGSFRPADLPGFDPTITGARAAPNYGITPSGATAYSPYGAMLPYEFPAISPSALGMSQPVYSNFNYGPYGLPAASSGTTAFDYLNGTAGPRPFSSYNARPFG